MITSTPEQNEKPTPPKLLIMGAPGSYKTTFMLQMGELFGTEGGPKLHVLDCDRNLEGPKRFLRQGYYDPVTNTRIPPPLPKLSFTYSPIRYDDKGSPREIYECYDTVVSELRLVKPGITKVDYDSCRIVGLDSLSHVNEFIIRKIMKLQGGGEMQFKTNWWTEFKSLAYSLLVSKLEETNRMVVCLAHETKITESDKDKITQQKVLGYEPFFQGKVGDTIGAFFTDVWRMDIRPGSAGRSECVLQTTRTPFCEFLKNSFGMPKEIVISDGSSNYQGVKAIEPYLKGKI